MVKYEVLFDYGEDPEGKAKKTFDRLEGNNELKALGMMGISTKAELKEEEGKKAVLLICSFGFLIPKSISDNAMAQVANTLEAQNQTKVTWRELNV